MYSAKAHEAKRMCSNVKHTFTNEGEFKRLSPMTPKCTLTLGIALVRESRVCRTLVKKVNKHQIGPLRYHWKGLEM